MMANSKSRLERNQVDEFRHELRKFIAQAGCESFKIRAPKHQGKIANVEITIRIDVGENSNPGNDKSIDKRDRADASAETPNVAETANEVALRPADWGQNFNTGLRQLLEAHPFDYGYFEIIVKDRATDHLVFAQRVNADELAQCEYFHRKDLNS